MKHCIFALCAATVAWPAAAQSTLTLSGIVDVAARYVGNEGVASRKVLVSGSNATSRLIFSGQEDLGGSLYAGFHLESGLLADTGASAATDKFFDRRSTLSLGDKQLGEIRLGRDYTPSYANWSRFDPFSYVGAARSANMVSATPTGPIRSAFSTNANTLVRADNTVQVLLPGNLGGFEGGLLAAPGEGGDRAQGLRLGWAQGGTVISVATTQTRNSLTTTGKFKDTALGGQYQFDNLRLSAAWRQFKYNQAKQTMVMLGAVLTSGPHEFKASLIDNNYAGRVGTTTIDANDARQIGLGYLYNFSKRTAVYTHVARISNQGASRLVISDGTAGMGAGGTSKGLEIGLRHRF